MSSANRREVNSDCSDCSDQVDLGGKASGLYWETLSLKLDQDIVTETFRSSARSSQANAY